MCSRLGGREGERVGCAVDKEGGREGGVCSRLGGRVGCAVDREGGRERGWGVQ